MHLPTQGASILLLGDSLSAGYNMPIEQSWPAQLQKSWQDQKINHILMNTSISGRTSAQGLAALPSLLEKHAPDWILIELGGNDGLQGLNIQTTQANLAQMIELAKKHGAQVILMQIRLPRNYGQRYIEQFEQIYPKLAKQYQIPLMPFIFEQVVHQAKWMNNDGIHPNAQAQPIIKNEAAKFLEPLLKSTAF